MNANEYREICNALMRNHHEKMLESAIQRNDADAVAHETAILYQLKANI